MYKKAGVLSGGERTRLAVARMLLRPSNTLLLDEPTNHLDLDSKDVLLDALEDYGGTLIIVSHDRYFVEKLATKIIEVGHGEGAVYPGTYAEFLWHKENKERAPGSGEPRARTQPGPSSRKPLDRKSKAGKSSDARGQKPGARPAGLDAEGDRKDRKRAETERRQQRRAADALRKRIAELESRVAEREGQVRNLEAEMSAEGFYDDPAAANATIDRHKSLMWEVGDLIAQWEALQAYASES